MRSTRGNSQGSYKGSSSPLTTCTSTAATHRDFPVAHPPTGPSPASLSVKPTRLPSRSAIWACRLLTRSGSPATDRGTTFSRRTPTARCHIRRARPAGGPRSRGGHRHRARTTHDGSGVRAQRPVTTFHQVLVGAGPGDAITNMALQTRDELRRLGPSEIFARFIEPESASAVNALQHLPLGDRPMSSSTTRASVIPK